MGNDMSIRALFSEIPPLFLPLFEGVRYPWEVLPRIGPFVRSLVERGLEGYRELAPGVLLGEGVTVYPTATVEGPSVIGAGTVLRPGAFLRGNVLVGEGCVIGNSTELKNCVLFPGAQVPHFNYVGDSILGRRAHMGAGTVCSNLKGDGTAVVIHGEEEHETGLRKVGAFLGDFADVGCGAVLTPGTVIGRESRVYPLTLARGSYPAGCIVKATREVVKKRPV